MSFCTNLIADSSSIFTYTGVNREVKSIPNELSHLPQIEMQQVHQNKIVEITNPLSQCVLNADAVYTSLPNVVLKVKHADCLPILINAGSKMKDEGYKNVIAAIHAGRKSTKHRILEKILNILHSQFSHSESGRPLGDILDLNVWFGPAICTNCYQIDQETDLHFDLIQENLKQIEPFRSKYDIRFTNYEHCTKHENEKYFSYRKEGEGVKMNWSGIVSII